MTKFFPNLIKLSVALFVFGVVFFSSSIFKVSEAFAVCLQTGSGTWSATASFTGCAGAASGGAGTGLRPGAGEAYTANAGLTLTVDVNTPTLASFVSSVWNTTTATTIVTINASSSLNVTGTTTFATPSANATDTILVNGTLDTGSFAFQSNTASRNQTLSVSNTGKLTLRGAMTVAGASGTKTFSTITGSGAIVDLNGGSIPATNLTTSIIAGTVLNSAGTSSITNASANWGAVTVSGGTFTVSGASTFASVNITGGTMTLGGVAVIVSGTTTVGNGTTLNASSGTGLKTFTGNVTVGTTATFDLKTGSNFATATRFGGSSISHSGSTFNTGTGAVTITGTGALAFSGSSNMSFGGTMTIPTNRALTKDNSATVTIGALSIAIPVAANSLTLTAGTTTVTGALTFSGVNNTANNQTITMSNDANLNVGSIVATSAPTAAGSSRIVCGASASGTLAVTGAGTASFTGNSTSTGTKTIDMSAGSCNMSFGGLLTLTGGTNATGVAQVIMGTGSLTLSAGLTFAGTVANAKLTNASSATITLTGTMTGAGTISIASGTDFNTSGTAGLSSAVTLPKLDVLSGTTTMGAVNIIISGATDVASGATLTTSSATGTVTFSGAVTVNSTANLTFSGFAKVTNFANGVTMNGTTFNTGTGLATIKTTAAQAFAGSSNMTFGGAVTIATGVTLTNNNTGIVTVGGTFTLTGNWTQGTTGNRLDLQGLTTNAITGGGVFTTTGAGNTVNYNSPAATGSQTCRAQTYVNLGFGGSGATANVKTCALTGAQVTNLTMSGTARWTTSNAVTISGNLDVGAGTILTTGATNTWTLTVGGDTSVSGTLTLNNTGAKSFGTLGIDTLTLNSGANMTAASSSTVTIKGIFNNNSGNTITIAGAIDVASVGTTVTLTSGTFSFTGGVTGTGDLVINNNSTTINGIVFSTTSINNTGTVTNSGTGFEAVSISSVIGTNVTGVTQNSTSSPLVLSGVNTYTGPTTLSGYSATIRANSSSALGDGTNAGNTLILNAGLLWLDADITSPSARAVTLSSTGSAIYTNGFNMSIAGNISGSGDLQKSGTGTLTLTGSTNTIGGGLTINTGTLVAPSGILSVGGNFSNFGTFTHSSGTVALTSTSTAMIFGDTTFNNLSVTGIGAAKTIQLNAGSTTTVAGTFTVTGTAGNLITLTSTTTSVWNINPTSASVDYADVSYSTNTGATICATHSQSTNGNNTGWNISAGASCGVTLSGTIYQTSNEASVFDCNAANITLHVSVNGGANNDGSCTSAGGTFSITFTDPGAANIPVVIYTDSAAAQKATTVTLSSGAGNISGISLMIGRVIVSQENATAMTNALMATGDNGDAGIRYNVATGDLTVESGMELHVLAGKSFTPGGSVTTTSTATTAGAAGDVHIASGATMTMSTNALNVGGDFTNAGTYSNSSGQVTTLTATGSGFTVTSGGAAFNNLTASGASGAWTLSGALTVASGGTTLSVSGSSFGLNINGGVTGTGNLITDADTNFSSSTIIFNTNPINNIGSITNTGSGNDSVAILGGVGSNVTSIIENSSTSNLAINASAVTVASGGTTLTVTAGVMSINGGVTGTGNLITDVDVNGAGSCISFSSSVNNTGIITNTGSGTCDTTINGGVGSNVTGITQNSTTSDFTIQTTSLTVNSGGTTLTNSSGTALLTVTGGVTGTGNLILNNNSSTNSGISISTTSVNNTGTVTNSGSSTGSVTISAVIGTNVTGVTQNSTTSGLTLTNTNTYTTPTTITAGILSAGATANLGDGSNAGNTLIFNGGTLKATGTITSPSTRAVTLTGAATFDTNGNAISIAGNMTGAGGVTKSSTGTLTLTGSTNTIGGNLTISAGTLVAPSGTLSVGGNFSNSGTFTHSSGTVALTGTTTAVISGNTTFNNLSVTGIGAAKTINFTDASTTTVSGTFTVTGTAGNLITLNKVTSAQWNINPTSASVDYADISYSNNQGANICAIHSQSTGGNNTGWTISAGGACGIIISGVSNGTGTVNIAVNGSLQGQTATISSGTWSLSGVSISTGQVAVVWINAVADSSESTAVAKYDGSGDMTGLVLNKNILSVGSVDDQSLTLSNLDLYDCANDEDIMYRVNASTLEVQGASTCEGSVSNSYTDESVQVESGDTLTVGSGETLSTDNINVLGTLTQTTNGVVSATGNYNQLSGTFNGGSGAVSLVDLNIYSGTFTSTSGTLTSSGNFINNSTFTHNSGTVTLTSSSSQSIIDPGSSSLNNLIINNASGTWSLSRDLTIANDLTMTAGSLIGSANLTVNGGDITGDGSIALTGSASNLYGMRDITSASYLSTCAVSNSGKVYCWGNDSYGALGNGAGGSTSVPALVEDGAATGADTDGTYLTNINSISSSIGDSNNFVCALANSGKVYCWGYDGSGQLGNGAGGSTTVPALVEDGVAAGADTDGTYLTNIKAIAVGQGHSCAVSNSSKTYCWGDDTYGELGNGATTGTQQTPNLVEDGVATGSDTDGTYLINIKSITASTYHTCAVSNLGKVYCWGTNVANNQLGNGAVGTVNTPSLVEDGAATGSDTDGTYLTNIRSVSASSFHTCAVSYSNKAYCWGDDTYGELGNGAGGDTTVPALVEDGVAGGSDTDGTYLVNIKSIVSGGSYAGTFLYTCAVSYSSKTYCWGGDSNGVLGNGATSSDQVTPILVEDGSAIGSDTDGTYLINIKSISIGGGTSCAISNSGKTYCWGYGLSGSLGDGLSASSDTPVIVSLGASTESPTTTLSGTGNFGGATAWSFYNVTMNGTTTSSGGGSITSKNLTLNSSKSLNAGSKTWNVAGNFANSGGTFTADTSTVTLTGTSTAVISGNTTFNNLSVTGIGAAKTIQLTAGSTTTVAGTFTVTGTAGNLITLTSTTTSVWNINPTSASVDYADVSYSTNTGATICATHSQSTNGNNTGWTISGGSSCATVLLSGTIYQTSNEASVFDCNAVNVSLHVSVGGGGNNDGSCTSAGGTFSFNIFDPGTANIPVVIYTDSAAAQKATTVTLSSAGATNITGISLMIDRVVVTQESATALTNTHMATADNGNAGIRYNVATGDLTVESGMELHVLAGKSFTPGGSVTTTSTATTSGAAGDVHIASGATMTMGTNALNVGGDFTNAGSFAKSTGQNTTFLATGTGFGITQASGSFYNLGFSGAGGGWTLPSNLAVDNNFNINTGTVTSSSSVLTVGGNFINNSTFTHNSGTVTLTSSSSQSIIDPGSSSLNNLIINNASGTWSLSRDLTIANDLTMTAGSLIGSANLTVNGGDITGDGSIALTGSASNLYGMSQVSAGSSHTCAVSNSGRVYCWGSDYGGELGNGAGSSTTVPALVEDGAATGADTDGTYLTNIKDVSVGVSYSCAVSNSGRVYCWGSDYNEQLGNGAGSSTTVPALVEDGVATGADTDGTYLTNIKSVSASSYNSCAVSNSGRVYCWGDDTYGQLGNGAGGSTTVPALVEDGVATGSDTDGTYLTNIKAVSAGSSHSCAVSNSGKAYCWGYDGAGQLGNGAGGNTIVPALVEDGAATGADTDGTYLVNIKAIKLGSNSSCAVSNLGKAYCWGDDSTGQLGNGAGGSATVPSLVEDGAATGADTDGTYLTNIKDISITEGSSCAVSNLGKAYCWGDDAYGELGNGATTGTQQTPNLVEDGSATGADTDGTYLTNIKSISISGYASESAEAHTCAVSNSGKTYCWGIDTSGGLGNGAGGNTTTPGFVLIGASVETATTTISGTGNFGGATAWSFYKGTMSGVTTGTGAGAITFEALLTVNGTFNQGASSNLTAGGVTVGGSGLWSNTGVGDITLSGNVSNSGVITIEANGHSSCGTSGLDDIIITTSDGTTDRSWSGSGTFNIWDVNAIHQTGSVTANSSTQGTGTTWTFVGCNIIVSGTIYQSGNEASVFNCSVANITLHVSVNGGTNTDGSCTSVGGTFSISGVSNPGAADVPIVVYTDSAAAQKATTVTLSSAGGANVTGLSLFIDRVNISQESGTATTNAMLSTGDNANAGIRYSVSAGALTVEDGMELHILSGKTFTPGGAVTTPSLHVVGTFNAGSNVVTLSGTGTPLVTPGTFNISSATVNYTGSGATTTAGTYFNLGLKPSGSSQQVIGAGTTTVSGNLVVGDNTNTGATAATNNPILNVTGVTTIAPNAVFTTGTGTWTQTGNLLVNGTLSGTANGTITSLGHVTGTGSVNLTTAGTFEQRAPSARDFGPTGSNNWSFYNLTFSRSSGTPIITTQTTGTGNVTVAGVMSVGKAGDGGATILDTGDIVWDLSGNGTPLVFNASSVFCAIVTCPESKGTFNYTYAGGAGSVSITPAVYFNLGAGSIADSNSASTFALSGDTTVIHGLTIGNPSSTSADVFSTGANYPLHVGFVTITSEGVFNANNSTIYLLGSDLGADFMNNGVFNRGNSTVTITPTIINNTVINDIKIQGSSDTNFYNFTSYGANSKISFGQGLTFGFYHNLVLNGSTSGGNVLLDSVNGTSQWNIYIDDNATYNFNNVVVKNSACASSSKIIAPDPDLFNGGNNDLTCWRFVMRGVVGPGNQGLSGAGTLKTGGGFGHAGNISNEGSSGGGGGTLPQAFTSSNGTALVAYDSSWAVSGGSFAVNNNTLHSNSADVDSMARWTAGSFNDNQYSEIKLSLLTSGGYIGTGVRLQPGSQSGYGAYTNADTGVKIIKWQNGTPTELYSGSAFSAGDILRLEISGTTLTLKQNGSTITTVSDSTFSSGRPGIVGNGNFSSSAGDDWYADSLASQGGGGGGGGGGGASLSTLPPETLKWVLGLWGWLFN